MKNVSLTVEGEKVLDNVSFILRPGDKTAFISRSDVTTSYLMQVIAGAIQPDAGTVTWGVTTARAYMPKDLNPEFSDERFDILEWLRQFAAKEESDNTFLRGFLGQMLFRGDEPLKKVTVLSGGEKVRSYLAKMMLSKANVLLLDDPTNHLDLESITSLNDALIDFPGAVIFTSHDHQFIQTIADHIIEVGPKGIVIVLIPLTMNSWRMKSRNNKCKIFTRMNKNTLLRGNFTLQSVFFLRLHSQSWS